MDKNQTYSSIRLQNFRSYTDFVVELNEGVNIVVGPNASGKTNLLEAFMVVSGFNSYRTNFDNLINFSADWCRIDAEFGDQKRVIKINTQPKLNKIYEINNKLTKRITYKDIVPVVLFEPNHMQLLTGSPETRRNYLDGILSKTDIEYAKTLRDYKKILNQRNNLLKKGDISSIFVWDIQFAQKAGYLHKKRKALVDILNNKLTDRYKNISNKDVIVEITLLCNSPKENYETELISLLNKEAQNDLHKGFTSKGPHRDDFLISLNGIAAEYTASRGETRTMILALKLLEVDLIETERQQKPLILLDDVFSELDGSRRKALTRYINTHQTIITTTDADIVTKEFAQNSNLISLS
jgi:DNA replication and repair protein RecF